MTGRWFGRRNLAADKVRLYCLPYAGAGSLWYRSWLPLLPDGIQLVPVNLPGREARFGEPPFTDLSRLVGNLRQAFAAEHDGTAGPVLPYGIFGHSMGSLLAFELARAIAAADDEPPLLLVVSGRQAPHIGDELDTIDLSSGASVRDGMNALGIAGPGLTGGGHLAELMEATLRADISLCHNYRFTDGPPLGVDILAIAGDADRTAPASGVRAWSRHTTGRFDMHSFAGGHFFLHDHAPEVAGLVGRALLARVTSTAI
ncbi:thioesterase II family protein [Melissospora conviva]|uniref:thioesterase II family protein n=1 Tax=Melissospora conviva TaxID=3388432 RepID=UPI003B8083C8